MLGLAVISAAGICAIKKGVFGKVIKKPDKLYHMTSLENYNSILNDGFIRKSSADLGNGISGVFISDMTSLKNKCPESALKRMVNFYRGNSSGKIAILEFDVSEIGDVSRLKWRPIWLREIPDSGNYSKAKFQKVLLIFDDFTSKRLKHLHKKPLEFIYPDTIQASKIKSVKIVDVSALNENRFVENFWKNIENQK